MTKEIVDVVIILDKSGSMFELTADTIGGFNSLIKKQKEDNDGAEAYVTTILFDDAIKCLHDALPIDKVPDLTSKDYCPDGATALYDAIGFAIEHEDERVLKLTRLNKKVPKKTLFVITTDGYENCSEKYKYSDIRKLIESRKEQGVSFMFIGADVDSDEYAKDLSIDEDLSFGVERSSCGVRIMMRCIGESISSCRKLRSSDELKKKLQDFRKNNFKEN